MLFSYIVQLYRAESRFAPNQWETSLQSNAVSHWLGANLGSALVVCSLQRVWVTTYCLLAWLGHERQVLVQYWSRDSKLFTSKFLMGRRDPQTMIIMGPRALRMGPIIDQCFYSLEILRFVPSIDLARNVNLGCASSDAMWHWKSWSTLVQLMSCCLTHWSVQMACCLTAPSHHLNQC